MHTQRRSFWMTSYKLDFFIPEMHLWDIFINTFYENDHFMERMPEFRKLSNIERESNAQKSKGVPPIDLADDKYFDSF